MHDDKPTPPDQEKTEAPAADKNREGHPGFALSIHQERLLEKWKETHPGKPAPVQLMMVGNGMGIPVWQNRQMRRRMQRQQRLAAKHAPAPVKAPEPEEKAPLTAPDDKAPSTSA